MQNLNCTTSKLACAQNKTADQVVAAEKQAISTFLNDTKNQWVLPAAVFRPTVDKSLITGDFADLLKSGKYNKKANVLWGYTHDEANAFVTMLLPNPVPVADIDTEFPKLIPYNQTRVLIKSPYYKKDNSTDSVRYAYAQGLTDFYWICPTQIFSRAAAKQKSTFYTYRMDYGRSSASALGVPPSPLCVGKVCHADDLIPSFGSGDVIFGVEQTGDDARFARQVIDRFTTFAKTGNPNPPKSYIGAGRNLGPASWNPDVTKVHWPKYDMSNPVYSFALANSSVTKNGDAKRCAWIDNNTQYDYQVHGPGGRFVPIFPPIPNPSSSSTKTTSRTKTSTEITYIQTPSFVPGQPTVTDTITTALTTMTTEAPITSQTTPPPSSTDFVSVSISASSSEGASESVSATASTSASLTVAPIVPTTSTATTAVSETTMTEVTTVTEVTATTAAPIETTTTASSAVTITSA